MAVFLYRPATILSWIGRKEGRTAVRPSLNGDVRDQASK
jgi:hypothetical protein